MKKIVLTLVALMSLTFANAAESNETVNGAEATAYDKTYDMSVDYNRLGTALGLTRSQLSGVEMVHNQFVDDMNSAADAAEGEKSEKLTAAVQKDRQYMRYILNDKQYNDYVLLIDNTLRNRGLVK